jgi:hypothetical protein
MCRTVGTNVCSFVGYEYEFDVCVSVAMLILTALDHRARATVPASQFEHPPDRGKEREKKIRNYLRKYVQNEPLSHSHEYENIVF